MSDTKLLLTIESRKKSGWAAAFLNLFLPGAGYAYCGRWLLAAVAFLFAGAIAIGSGDATNAAPLAVIFFIDGFFAAGRFNKKLIASVLAEDAATAGQSK